MSVVKISALTVVADGGADEVRRAAAQAEAAAGQDGFEGSELLKPADERTTWLIVTRWRDEEASQAWERWRVAHEPRPTVRRPGDAPRQPVARGERPGKIKPVLYSEYWSYEVAGGSAGGAS